MSPKAEAITDQFRSLSKMEQWDVFEAIARAIFSEDYGELSDEELIACASQTFAMLDQEESRANSR
jgi:hypothetical protein